MTQPPAFHFQPLTASHSSALQQIEASLRHLLAQNPLLTPDAQLVFETLSSLGEGGMGKVYRVRDKRLERDAALKILSDALADETMRQRFVREARITARLVHPAIPPVYGLGLTNSQQLFMVMKVVEGQTLKQRLADLDQAGLKAARKDLLEALIKVADGVAYAHNAQVLHRDLKPENIMIGQFGEVLVMDWGLARDVSDPPESVQGIQLADIAAGKVLDSQSRDLTQAGAFLGTAGYAAPEQVEGGELDERCDVFALGCILCEILTGERAIAGHSDINRISATLKGQITHPRDLDSSLPAELDWIARQALEADRELRTESSSKFAKDLRAYLASELISDYPYSWRERLSLFVKRRPLLIVSLAFVAVLVSITLVFAMQLYNSQQQLLKEQRLAEVLEKEKDRAKLVLESLEQARINMERGRTEDVRPLLENTLGHLASPNEDIIAARIAEGAGFDDLATSILVKTVERYPPAYGALYQLHFLQLKKTADFFKWTPALETIRARGQQSLASKVPNPYVLLSEACYLRDQRDFVGALKVFQRCADLYKDFMPIFIQRGNFWKSQKRWAEAIADFSRALEINPRYVRAYHERASVYQLQGEFRRALSDLDTGIEMNPRYGYLFHNRASIRLSLGDSAGALRDYNKAVALDGSYAYVYGGRGHYFSVKKDARRAMEDLDKAIQLDPTKALFFVWRARVHRSLKSFEKALADYNKACELDSENARLLLSRALFMESRGGQQQALETLTAAIRERPKDADLYEARCRFYQRVKDFEAALEDINRALELEPDNGLLYSRRHFVYLDLGNFSKAFQDIQEGLKKRPNDPTLHYNLAYLHRDKRRYEVALEVLNKAIKLAPRESDNYDLLGKIYTEMKRLEDAQDAFTKAIDCDRRNAMAYANRALIHRRLDNRNEAIRDCGRALDCDPTLYQVYVNRGQLTELTNPRQALADFEAALKYNPPAPMARSLQRKVALLRRRLG